MGSRNLKVGCLLASLQDEIFRDVSVKTHPNFMNLISDPGGGGLCP